MIAIFYSVARGKGFASVKLRPATLDDATTLFAWINDEATFAATIEPRRYSWEQHLAWLTDVLKSPRRRLLIAEAGRPVGAVHINYGSETEMTWTVAPEARGKGYGKAMVSASLPDQPVIANIRSANTASQRVAEAVGFVLVSGMDVQRWERLKGHDLPCHPKQDRL